MQKIQILAGLRFPLYFHYTSTALWLFDCCLFCQFSHFFKTFLKLKKWLHNDDFDGKENHLNCFYMHMIFEQKYPKPALVSGQKGIGIQLNFPLLAISHYIYLQCNFVTGSSKLFVFHVHQQFQTRCLQEMVFCYHNCSNVL